MRPISLRTDDPDEFTDAVQPIVSGVRISATAPLGFRSRLRAWRLPRCALLSIRVDAGRADFSVEEGRGYGSFTLPLVSGFLAGGGPRTSEFALGLAHALAPAAPEAAIQPHVGSHLLGVIVAAPLLAAHTEALEGRWGSSPPPPEPILRTTTPAGRRLLRQLDETLRGLLRPGSLLHAPRVAREVEDALVRALVEAWLPEAAAAAFPPPDASSRRAEEFLAAQLDRPISLCDVANATHLSTRTLSRVFQQRHGMGPIAFLRRRRLEAARRDLLDGEPGETRVTDVALRYGFAHLGRFAVDYRRSFGESPSDTLRR